MIATLSLLRESTLLPPTLWHCLADFQDEDFPMERETLWKVEWTPVAKKTGLMVEVV